MPANKEIQEKILQEIGSLSSNEQETVLGIVENYVHNKIDETEWEQLPEEWKNRIAESLSQADTGQFVLHEDAVAYIRKKYGLNG